MRALTKMALPFVAAVTSTMLYAAVKLPEIFNSHMVLQREVKLPVWGTANAGEQVTVKINDQEKNATADATGKWKLELDPLKAGGPFKMEIKGTNTINLDDVLVGEVWLCSGQSNMQWTVNSSNDSTNEIANANYQKIRLFNVKRTWNNVPQTNSLQASWNVCNPTTIPGFSAVGYFFGRELHKKLDTPVGLINSSWGGTRIEPWTPPVGFKLTPTLKSISAQVEAKIPGTVIHKKLTEQAIQNYTDWIKQSNDALKNNKYIVTPKPFPADLTPYTNHQQPTVLYNTMINPFVPFAIRGAIWYQGESNHGEGMLYAEKMKALINGWRSIWNNPQMPFYFVQLAPYQYGSENVEILPICWQAQIEVDRTVPYTGMAVINDIGNIKNIHPKNKQEVGRRLALLALNQTYGQKDVVCKSPVFKEMKIEKNAVKVIFDNSKTLKTRDGKAPTWFEICGLDGIFYKANVQLDGNTAIVTAEEVGEPLAVKFAWNKIAEPNLTNEAGLPASAFKSGSVPVQGILNALVPEAKDYKLVYVLDPSNPIMAKDKKNITYKENKTKEIVGAIKKIGYAMILNGKDYVFVTMDPFTTDLKKIGVPTVGSGAQFQQKINNMTVKSNVKGIKNGTFENGGNIEFWPSNYTTQNSAKIPGASDSKYDFGDQRSGSGSGYGSMQVHNYNAKQTVIAFNHFTNGRNCDLGIGNNPKGHPDWTFANNGSKYKSAMLFILVKTE